MSNQDPDKNKKNTINYDLNEEDDSGQGSFGGTGDESGGGIGGKIHFRFRDAASLPPRDDVLPITEIKRLLIVHGELHKERVDKQKQTRKERAALKEGKKLATHGQQQRQGFGGSARFKQHPIANKAQFSGIDKQVTGLPTEFDAETNAEMQDRLENRLQNRLQHQNVPRFNPTPRPKGG
jgi:hypothetical protein